MRPDGPGLETPWFLRSRISSTESLAMACGVDALAKRAGGDHIDAFVGALRREQHSDQ